MKTIWKKPHPLVLQYPCTPSSFTLSPGHTALVHLGPNMCSTTLLHVYVCSVQLQQTSLDYACVSDEMLEQQVPVVRAGFSRFLEHWWTEVCCGSSIQAAMGSVPLQETNVGHRTS